MNRKKLWAALMVLPGVLLFGFVFLGSLVAYSIGNRNGREDMSACTTTTDNDSKFFFHISFFFLSDYGFHGLDLLGRTAHTENCSYIGTIDDGRRAAF